MSDPYATKWQDNLAQGNALGRRKYVFIRPERTKWNIDKFKNMSQNEIK
ncbi:MAG: hypothetical protein WAO52_02095 [Prolixibacteraceae bacterium]